MENGILDTLVGVLARPASTIRGICQQRPIAWAIIIYLSISVVTTIVWIETADLDPMGLAEVGMPAIVMVFSIANIVTLVVLAAIYHLVASLLGGKGSYSGLFSGLAFASLPVIFVSPLAVVEMLPMVGPLLSDLGTFGVAVWSLVLSILALRENYLVSTGRAILIFFLMVVILFVLLFVLFIGLLPLGA